MYHLTAFYIASEIIWINAERHCICLSSYVLCTKYDTITAAVSSHCSAVLEKWCWFKVSPIILGIFCLCWRVSHRPLTWFSFVAQMLGNKVCHHYVQSHWAHPILVILMCAAGFLSLVIIKSYKVNVIKVKRRKKERKLRKVSLCYSQYMSSLWSLIHLAI